MSQSGFHYRAIPSLQPFHSSNKPVRIVRGPIGSGKSTAMACELLRRAAEQAPQEDGVRRTRFVITRNTYAQLKSTALATIEQLFRPIMRFKTSDSTIQIRFADIESDWMLIPLDTEQNIERLLSLELTGAWASELRELDPKLITEDLFSRCGRYPSKALGGPSWHGLIAESNSFRIDSPWYDLLENNRPEGWDYFVQPGARDPECDWREFLVDDYYENMVQNNTPEWVAQYIDNEYGPSLDGEAVYKNSFKREFHVATGPLTPVPAMPLIIGCDFARWPAAVFCQIDPRGRFLVYAEVERENCGIETFTRENIVPLLSSQRFRSCPVFIVGDPSGAARSQIGEESVFDALRRLGIPAYPASTNHIAPRIRAVEKYLIQQRDGRAALLIDPECKKLIEGFSSKYRYKRKKTGEVEDTPDKQRPWADLHDALQYACLGTAKGLYNYAVNRFSPPKLNTQPAVSAAGWT